MQFIIDPSRLSKIQEFADQRGIYIAFEGVDENPYLHPNSVSDDYYHYKIVLKKESGQTMLPLFLSIRKNKNQEVSVVIALLMCAINTAGLSAAINTQTEDDLSDFESWCRFIKAEPGPYTRVIWESANQSETDAITFLGIRDFFYLMDLCGLSI